MLLNITGGSDMGLFEIDEAASIIRQAAHEECNVIFGAVVDDSMGDQLRVTVIATGFDGANAQEPEPAAQQRSAPRYGRDDSLSPQTLLT